MDDPTRPAAIEATGVPRVPPELRARLERYQEIRSARPRDWHPSGEWLLVTSRVDDVHRLYLAETPLGVLRPLTRGVEAVWKGRFLPRGSLVFERARGGDEQYQIYHLKDPLRKAEETLLTDGSSRHILQEIHPDGRRIAVTSTRRNGRDQDLYFLDVRNPGAYDLLLQVERETWWLADFSPDGTKALVARYVSRNESYGAILDLASRKLEQLPAESRKPGARQGLDRIARGAFRFGPGGTVFFTTDARGEFRELARLDLSTGRTRFLSGDLPWDVEAFEISADRKRAVFTVNAEGFSRLFVLEELEGETPKRREIDLGLAIVSSLRFHPNGKRIALGLGRPVEPFEVYALDLESARLEQWTRSERAGFDPEDFVAPRLIRYRSFDGRMVPCFMYLPARRSANVPVLIRIHGGPESQFRPSFSPEIQFFVRESGIAVLAPNVRGSTGYGKTYSLLDNGRKREDSVRDIGALLDWIRGEGRDRYGLDPERVAVMGGSYGGYMVLASLVHYGERIRCGVDIVGISDFVTFLENTKAYRRDLRRAEYGDESDPEMRKFLASISPARRIERVRTPLLVAHGRNDPRVPISEAEQIVSKLRARGVHVWTVYAANEGHGFVRRENRDYLQAAIVLFLERFLLDKAPPAESDGSAEARRPAGAERGADKDRPAAGAALHRRAGELFRARRFREAAAAYELAIRSGGPHDENSCWERGLALYYAGDFTAAAEQFARYHTVGPLDIENGIWRLLSMAETEGLAAARRAFYPYPRKVRPPFPALHTLYAGKGSAEAVFEEAKRGAEGSALEERLFYAHYYVAKYLELTGKRREAAAQYREALRHPIRHFMYDCARIDLERIEHTLKTGAARKGAGTPAPR